MDNEFKHINIIGTNNKYQMKKIMEKITEKEIKKRVQTKNWLISDENFEYSKQLQMIIDISNNNFSYINNITKIAIQEIKRKINGYKQQDIIKNHFNKINFLTFESIIYKMIECKLKCRYCKNEMNVLYDILREKKQWSVDRIDNNFGHNENNYHLACLDCNLKRRRRSDANFLFTKQLNIIKKD